MNKGFVVRCSIVYTIYVPGYCFVYTIIYIFCLLYNIGGVYMISIILFCLTLLIFGIIICITFPL